MKKNYILLITLFLLISCDKKQSTNIDVYENVKSEEKNQDVLQEEKSIDVQEKRNVPTMG